MARLGQPLQQFEPAHSGQIGIDQQAGLAARAIGFEEGLAGRIVLDGPAVRPRARARIASRMWLSSSTTKMIGRAPACSTASAAMRRAARASRLRRGSRRWMACSQLLQLHRLVELHAVLTRDIAQGVGRYVAGQDDDRDLAMQLFPQLRGDLEPVHAVRQIVVGQDEIGPDRPSRHQFQRRDPVRRRRRAMALVLEQELEQFAHLGIVLDDQDRAGAVACRFGACLGRRRAGRGCRRRGRRPAAASTSMAKTEPLPGLRADADPVAQQIAQALHDRQAEAEAAAAFARGIVELMVLLEDRLKFLLGNADAGIPDLDAQHVSVPAAAEQHLAARGVFQRVRQAGCGSSAPAGADRCGSTGRTGPRARQAAAPARDR